MIFNPQRISESHYLFINHYYNNIWEHNIGDHARLSYAYQCILNNLDEKNIYLYWRNTKTGIQNENAKIRFGILILHDINIQSRTPKSEIE